MAQSVGSGLADVMSHIFPVVILFLLIAFVFLLRTCFPDCFGSRREASRRRRMLDFEENATTVHTTGLDRETMDALPVFEYRSESFNEGLECAVCLSEFEENEKGRLLPKCSHTFHTECIDMWFYSHSTCPLCRATVQPNPSTQENSSLETSSNVGGRNESLIHGQLVMGQRRSSPVQLQNLERIIFWIDPNGTSERTSSHIAIDIRPGPF